MQLTGAQALLKALEMEKVDTIFGYPGAAICPFYDVLPDSVIRHVLTRHEQAAVHAASGYARSTGRTGVCVATSGPGATNMITGIATAYMDSIPVVAITGQVARESIGRDVFQEVDITGATEPFCKHNYLVKNPQDLPRIVREAFHIASTGRPGPVLIDVPVDVQNSLIEFQYPETVEIRGYKPNYKGHRLQVRKVADAIRSAKAPVICAGGGVITAEAAELLQKLAETCGIPVVTTLMGIGAMPAGHPLYMGMLGSHGVPMANYAVHHADVLIVMGARVGDRAMGSTAALARKATIVHIDIDPAEIGKNIGTAIPVVGDVRRILEDLLEMAEPSGQRDWLTSLDAAAKERKISSQDDLQSEYIHPRYLLEMLSQKAPSNTILTTEVGQNQIWCANHYQVKGPRSFITSGGMGTMGYGLPAAVGAKLGNPSHVVVAVAGDGSFQMNLQELGTIRQCGLGIKIILLNNARLGMVREIQKTKYGGRYSQVFLDCNPDFVKLAGAYGIEGECISNNRDVEAALDRMLADDRPYLLECRVDPEQPTL